jgi:hypothetical protein
MAGWVVIRDWEFTPVQALADMARKRSIRPAVAQAVQVQEAVAAVLLKHVAMSDYVALPKILFDAVVS